MSIMPDDTRRTFTIRVTARRTPSNEVEGSGWFSPEDFVNFLHERYTVGDADEYGLDAYNKDAPQLISNIELVEVFEPESTALPLIHCRFCFRVLHMDAEGTWRDNTDLKKCDRERGNHRP